MRKGFYLGYPDHDAVSREIPERALLFAILERALRDLTPAVTDDQKYLRSAVAWFRAKSGAEYFTFAAIADELRLSKIFLTKIEGKVRKAEKYVHSEDRLKKINKKNKFERERQAGRASRIALVKRTRVPFRPEKPTVQWNGWNIGYNS